MTSTIGEELPFICVLHVCPFGLRQMNDNIINTLKNNTIVF